MFALKRGEHLGTSSLPLTTQLLVTMMHAPQVNASGEIQFPQLP
jgi:hypothetical protein